MRLCKMMTVPPWGRDMRMPGTRIEQKQQVALFALNGVFLLRWPLPGALMTTREIPKARTIALIVLF